MIKEGFSKDDPEGVARVGSHLFAAAEDGRESEETTPHSDDQARILAAIREASSRADCVLVSIHSHE